jgi:hypothetical protein
MFKGFYGVMVSTLDFESSDPSSNLGRTFDIFLTLKFITEFIDSTRGVDDKVQSMKWTRYTDDEVSWNDTAVLPVWTASRVDWNIYFKKLI